MMRQLDKWTFETLRGLIAAGLLVTAQYASATSITLDYSMDDSGFFGVGTDARTVLEAARDFFEVRVTDVLGSIMPGGGNTWTATGTDPSTGAGFTINDMTLVDEIIVFVGARDLEGSLGKAGPGGHFASGSQTFLDSVELRGQGPGVGTTETAIWGGSIALDINTTWNFDVNSGGGSDALSVLLHEFGHVFGFGTVDAFDAMVNGSNQFTGAESESLFGGSVPLDGIVAHFAAGTSSNVAGGTESYIGALAGAAQETAMDPNITIGTRKLFTDLDLAVLDDIGWDIENPPAVIPLPAGVWMLLSGIVLLGLNGNSLRRPVDSET